MSANADYDVKIVESFAPPANWIPGQTINKDVYATNTGNVPAFVKETVTSRLNITKEVAVDVTLDTKDVSGVNVPTGKIGTDANALQYKGENVALEDCIELDYDEIYATEAGSYLAYKPDGSDAELGRLVVSYDNTYDPNAKNYMYKATGSDNKTYYVAANAYDETNGVTAGGNKDLGGQTIPADLAGDTNKSKWTKVEAPAKKTDFTPDSEGLYVFRRFIDVAPNGSEQFEYDAYYYKDGHYYKVKNLTVVPDDKIDLADDGKETDGQLANVSKFSLAKDVQEVVIPTLTYDQANNRLVATYGDYADDARNDIIGSSSNAINDELANLAKTLDEEEHDLVAARAALDAAMSESAKTDAQVATDRANIQAIEAAIADVNARIAELNARIGDVDAAGNDILANPVALQKKVNDLVDTLTTVDANTDDLKKVQDALTTLYGASNKDKFSRKSTANNATDNEKNGITFNENRVTDNTTGTEADAGSKYAELLAKQRAYDIAKDAYGDDVYEAYFHELKTAFPTETAAATNFDEAVAALTYDKLTSAAAPHFTDGTELHTLNQKVVDLLKAQLEYDQAYRAAKDAVSTFLDKLDTLGNAVNAQGAEQTETIGGKTITYHKYNVSADTGAYPEAHNTDDWKWTTASGLKNELETLKAERAKLKEKLDSLNAARDEAYQDSVNHQTYTPANGTASAHTAAENLDTAKAAYTAAYKAYVAAKQAYDQKKAEYDAADNLRIYINLANVVTEGGIAKKWQIVPVGTENKEYSTDNTDTATFYYTSILPGGQTSTMLIDSLELDENATQDMYKSFDFDLNVGLESRQIAYTQDDPSILDTRQLAGFGADVAFDDKTDEDTALTWTQAGAAATDPSATDTTGSTYKTSIIKNSAYTVVTVTKDTTEKVSGYPYSFTDSSVTYVGKSTAAGTVFVEIEDDGNGGLQIKDGGNTYTLTQDGIKQ